MEARDLLSALGSAGAFWIRRTAIRFLSSCFVDIGRINQRDLSLGDCVTCLHLDCAGAGRRFDVCAGAALA